MKFKLDFLNKTIVYKDKKTIVTLLQDVITSKIMYIVKSEIPGDFKNNLSKELNSKACYDINNVIIKHINLNESITDKVN